MKHGKEFGDISIIQYLKLAKEFAGEIGEHFQEAIVGNFIIKHSRSDGRILIGHIKDRLIRTFYKDDGRAKDAFQAAIELAKDLAT